MVSTGGGIIDGRFSFSAGTPGDGFVAVEVSTRNPGYENLTGLIWQLYACVFVGR